MMEITYLGHSSFRIKGREVTIVIDPYEETMVGFKFPKVEAQVVIISHDHEDHNKKDLVEGLPFVVSRPGEYEIKGASIFGIPTFHDNASGTQRGGNICFLIELDGLKLFHLGDLGCKFTDGQLSQIGEVDILFVPVGGVYTLGPKEAVEVVGQIEPGIVIPMHYKTSEINQKSFGQLSELADFLKEMGDGNVITEQKLTIGKLDLTEETRVVVLERKSG